MLKVARQPPLRVTALRDTLFRRSGRQIRPAHLCIGRAVHLRDSARPELRFRSMRNRLVVFRHAQSMQGCMPPQ
eukprot:348427-Pleurochrysis_carterae.AAC.2